MISEREDLLPMIEDIELFHAEFGNTVQEFKDIWMRMPVTSVDSELCRVLARLAAIWETMRTTIAETGHRGTIH